MLLPSRLFAAAPAPRAAFLSCLVALLIPGGGCRSPQDFKRSADSQVYELVAKRRAEIASRAYVHEEPFTIEPPSDSLRARVLEGQTELGVLRMADLLDLAAEESREYRRQRENLYLTTLDLTLASDVFTNRYFGGADGIVASSGGEADFAQVSPFARVTRFLESGAALAFDVGLRVFRDLSTGDAWTTISDVGLGITQPLMRGSGRRIAREPLTQAERNVVYAARDYERFRRSFAFEVANRAFRILQQHNVIENVRVNLSSLRLLRERNEALAEAGRLSDIQVDQARQDELRSENRIVEEEASLQASYDDFKLFLGLPMGASFVVDPIAFERLRVEESLWVDGGAGPLARLALARRLDFLTAEDRLVDAERQVYIRTDALRAGLDVDLAASLSSDPDRPFSFDIDDLAWQAGLDLDLPWERTAERNAFRESLVVAERALRDVQAATDTITRDIRDELRNVRQTRETYEIQARSVELAERRVESAQLSFDAGRATTRDLLEAREDLLDAQNAATQALVSHYLSLLALFRDMEILVVDESGLSVDADALAILNEVTP